MIDFIDKYLLDFALGCYGGLIIGLIALGLVLGFDATVSVKTIIIPMLAGGLIKVIRSWSSERRNI